jgi:hypothetical protein
MYHITFILLVAQAYEFSNNYSPYVFEGISDYDVFLTTLKRVQVLEKYMANCRKQMLSGFYEGQWILTDADGLYEPGSETHDNFNLGPEF